MDKAGGDSSDDEETADNYVAGAGGSAGAGPSPSAGNASFAGPTPSAGNVVPAGIPARDTMPTVHGISRTEYKLLVCDYQLNTKKLAATVWRRWISCVKHHSRWCEESPEMRNELARMGTSQKIPGVFKVAHWDATGWPDTNNEGPIITTVEQQEFFDTERINREFHPHLVYIVVLPKPEQVEPMSVFATRTAEAAWNFALQSKSKCNSKVVTVFIENIKSTGDPDHDWMIHDDRRDWVVRHIMGFESYQELSELAVKELIQRADEPSRSSGDQAEDEKAMSALAATANKANEVIERRKD